MNELTRVIDSVLVQAGEAANRAAARHVFAEYRQKRAARTIRRQDADLLKFSDYLFDVASIETGDLESDPMAWEGVTWGLVKGFAKWMLDRGYSVGSVNVSLSTVRTYCKLAAQAGAMDQSEYAMVRTVGGYKRKEGKHIDKRRIAKGQRTRISTKKASPIALSQDQAARMKAEHASDGQGRRDRLMMCLLLDHGLRVGELAGLMVENFDIPAGKLTFYREKVDKIQTHGLTDDALRAARLYSRRDAPSAGTLLRSSTSSGRLTSAGMTTRAITDRVRVIGERIGIEGLSAHDLRHTWATIAARCGTPIDRLMQAGGWSSYAMPLRYIEAAKVANEGVRPGRNSVSGRI